MIVALVIQVSPELVGLAEVDLDRRQQAGEIRRWIAHSIPGDSPRELFEEIAAREGLPLHGLPQD